MGLTAATVRGNRQPPGLNHAPLHAAPRRVSLGGRRRDSVRRGTRYVLCVMYGLLIALYAGSFIWDAARDKASPRPHTRTHARARTATVLVAVAPCAA